MTSNSAAIAAYAAGLPYAELTDDAVHSAKDRLLDTLAAMLGAWLSGPSKLAREYALMHDTPDGSSVIGIHGTFQPEAAALANAIHLVSSNLGDADETGEFAPCETIPPLLALAETFGIKGEDLILGIVVAYDVAIATGSIFAGGVAGAGAMLGREPSQIEMALDFPMSDGTTAMGSAVVSRNVVTATLFAVLGLGDDCEGQVSAMTALPAGGEHAVTQVQSTDLDGNLRSMTSADVASKFADIASGLLMDNQIEEAIAIVGSLDEVDDVGVLMGCLTV